jgi:hypothetical protein
MSEKPEEPDFDKLEKEFGLTPFDEDALQMNEMFHSFMRAGFREKQALQLIAMIVGDSGLYYSVDVDGDDDDGEEPHGAR